MIQAMKWNFIIILLTNFTSSCSSLKDNFCKTNQENGVLKRQVMLAFLKAEAELLQQVINYLLHID